MARREPQTKPLLQGDLTPRRTDGTDLRNDNAGDYGEQAQSIVIRYLENLPAEATVNVATMAQDIERRYPFHGEGEGFFNKIVDGLVKEGWVKKDGNQVQLHKIARVTRRFLLASSDISR
jgi:hypothetical protein